MDSTCADKLYRIPKSAGAFRCNVPKGCATRVCRACGDGTACVAAEYLALRIGRGMGAHCAPLRKKKSSAVPLFGAVSSLRFSPCPLRKRGRFTRRRKPQVVSFLCPRRAGELDSLRKRPHDTAAQSRFYKLSIEYIHVKRNRQNCTKCPLNKNEPARRFAALILGWSKDADFTENKMNRIRSGCSYIQTHPGKG